MFLCRSLIHSSFTLYAKIQGAVQKKNREASREKERPSEGECGAVGEVWVEEGRGRWLSTTSTPRFAPELEECESKPPTIYKAATFRGELPWSYCWW
jgi:hypothetical protein